MTGPLLATKLFVPPVRPDRVRRPRLLERLNGVQRQGMLLILISAPAGFGKTSLLAEWIAQMGQPAGWVSLESGENDPYQFLGYLMAAIGQAVPGALKESPALLGEPGRVQPPGPPHAILALMVNELSAPHPALDPARPAILALDDFHLIQSSDVHAAVQFLVEHLPPGLRVAIATRADPPLPLPRLRARGQMVELRAADLRFTAEEAAEFLIESMGVRLDPVTQAEIVAGLTARTEGWAAGLQMAALALQATPQTDAAEFLRTFSGSHRYVLDYLAEEVLARMPEESVAFLLRTSILDRSCAGLCAALQGAEPGNAEAAGRCQAILEELERSNLFLIPLDADRTWFRYHHLFADLLRARLKQSHPEWMPLLHGRATIWLEHNSFIAEAIHHALAGGDYEHAARLVEGNTVALLIRGELHGVLRWINMLPASLVAQRPWLAVYRAIALYFSGQLAQTEETIRTAEAHLAELSLEEQQKMAGYIAMLRCQAAALSDHPENTFALADIAKDKLPPEAVWAKGIVEWAVGFASRALGDVARAAEIFERELYRAWHEENNPWAVAMNATDLGIVRRSQGRLRDARQAYETGLAFVTQSGGRQMGYVGRLLAGMAGVLYDQNELAEARVYLEEAIRLNQNWRNPNHLVFASLNLARVLAAQGDLRSAEAQLDAADQVLHELPVVLSLRESVYAVRASLQPTQDQPLAGGDLDLEFKAALAALDAPEGTERYTEGREVHRVFLARALLAQNRYAEALRLLDSIEQAARQTRRRGGLVEVLTLTALAQHAQGKKGAALDTMLEALTLARPETMIRPIIDTAPLVPGALEALLQDGVRRSPASRDFANRLLADIPHAAPTPDQAGDRASQPANFGPAAQDSLNQQPVSPQNRLVDPLTDREQEVLGLMAEGLTNAQIGERLVITTGTVKAHTAGIFRKLDVANRTQAVTRARELGLLR